MVGYSEVINVMAAMVLFSLILLTSNRMILLNSMKEVESEAETTAINLAQNFVDEARMKPFSDESASPVFGPEGDETVSGNCKKELTRYDDFDDYDGYDCPVTSTFGDNAFNIKIAVNYLTNPEDSFAEGNKSTETDYKKMRVTVTSQDYLTNSSGEPVPVYLEYLRIQY